MSNCGAVSCVPGLQPPAQKAAPALQVTSCIWQMVQYLAHSRCRTAVMTDIYSLFAMRLEHLNVVQEVRCGRCWSHSPLQGAAGAQLSLRNKHVIV